ncbi:TonB-dependent receptor plug domain-containing protein [Pasteurellaceae bacterium LIM206]|nr:TonB-dependent receptor plug domain-containing protein [Pasteurellaceae bacterium LIM206]
MKAYRLNRLSAFYLCMLAAPTQASEDNGKDHQLDEIVVYANQNKELSSAQVIDKEKIKRTPNANGNVTDYLKSNPHVRFEQSDQDGTRRGEIKPENISINGADPNQTAYLVDNVNINNDLMEDNEVFDGAMRVIPGLSHTQAYFFDANLLSSIVLYDSNISASLGGFTGGAVVAKTKQYDGKNRVKISYRTTDSSWAKLHADGDTLQKLNSILPDSSLQAIYQPKYNKQFFNLTVEQALTENLGMVAGFSRRGSHIKQSKLVSKTGKRDDQYYKYLSDTALVNFNWTPNENNRFEFGLRYSNYRESKFYPNTLGNNVKDYHQAYGATFAWIKSFDNGVLTTTLAYDRMSDKRDSASSHAEIVSILDEDWNPLADYELGGYGDSQLRQQNVHLSSEYAVTPFNWGAVTHSISVGGLYQLTRYHFNRDQDVTGTTTTIIKNNPEIRVDQLIAKKGTADTQYQNVALYAEDLMSWRNLELRAGIRAERDDYLKNTNIAPRVVTKWKPFDDTAFIAGYNRYYGRSFASLKLTDKILTLNGDPTRRYEQLNSLKTPYADEYSLGIEQNIGNFALSLKYIHRKNKQRIVLERDIDAAGNSVDHYRNGKPYDVNVYTLQIQNIEPWELGKTYWHTGFAFDWLDTKLNDLHRTVNGQEIIYLDGKKMTREEMRKKLNAGTEQWTVRMNVDMALPDYGITWSNNLWVKAPIKGYEEINDPFYRSYHYGSHPQWDMRLRWQPTFAARHKPYIQVDMLNVLDRTRKIMKRNGSDNFGEYTPGREFWLEVGYEF